MSNENLVSELRCAVTIKRVPDLRNLVQKKKERKRSH